MAEEGSIEFSVDLDVGGVDRKIANLKSKILRLEKQINDAKTKSAPIEAEARQIEEVLSRERVKLAKMQREYDQLTPLERWNYDTSKLDAQKQRVDELTAKWGKVVAKLEPYENKIRSANEEIESSKLEMAELERAAKKSSESSSSKISELATKYADSIKKQATQVKENLRGILSQTNRMHGRASNTIKRILSLAQSALVFSAITQTLTKFRERLSDTIKMNDNARKALANLKGAFLTMIQPIVAFVIPVLTNLMNILSKIITVIGEFIARIFGTTGKEAANTAEQLENEKNAIDEVGDAAEEAGGKLASFDQINVLTSENAKDSSIDEIKSSSPDFSKAGDLSWIKETLGESAGYVVDALILAGIAAIAMGASLANLALIGVGLLLLGSSYVINDEMKRQSEPGSWSDRFSLDKVKKYATTALQLGGIALIAMGAMRGSIFQVVAGILLVKFSGDIANLNLAEMKLEDWKKVLNLDKVKEYASTGLMLGGIALIAMGAMRGSIFQVVAGIIILGFGVYVNGLDLGEVDLEDWVKKFNLDAVLALIPTAISLCGIALIAIGAMLGNILQVIAGGIILGMGIYLDQTDTGEHEFDDFETKYQIAKIKKTITDALEIAGLFCMLIGAMTLNIPLFLAGISMLGFAGYIAAGNSDYSALVAEEARLAKERKEEEKRQQFAAELEKVYGGDFAAMLGDKISPAMNDEKLVESIFDAAGVNRNSGSLNLYNGVSSSSSQNVPNNINLSLDVNLDGETIARNTIEHVNSMNTRNGYSPEIPLLG